MTIYIVLTRDSIGPDSWAEVGRYDAISNRDACLKGARADNKSGAFIAVPERSFQPIEIESVTETRIRLKPAKATSGAASL